MQTQEFTFDLDLFSDLHKDAYGFRPRGDYFAWLETSTDAEKQVEWDSLLKALERRMEEDAAIEKASIAKFEELVTKTINSGARNRETALRWIMDASEARGDWEYFCYLNGLPYGYFKKVA